MRRQRIPAREAPIGKRYLSLNGTPLTLCRKINSRWKTPRPNARAIAYKIAASGRSKDPLRQVTVYGWLDGDYMLLPMREKL